MYESNDDDHMTLVDQRKIAPVFGTMDDFDMLLKDTQKMASMYGNMTFLNEILKIFCRMWNLISTDKRITFEIDKADYWHIIKS